MLTVAYYLGQYHPLEENNRYWGAGFTEWHNVAKARPLFPGHIQPVLPGILGFYDLRNDSAILAQLDYAKEIGVDAFCYWHYWFAGKCVLDRPLDRMLALPDRGVKVMLGWANESWTGIWHGLADQVIFQQTYDREELNEHARLIAAYLQSDRYLRLGELSPLLIYKPRLIPDPQGYLNELRERVRYHGGGDLYLIGTWGPGRSEQVNRPADLGLDAVVANNVGRYFNSGLMQIIYSGAWQLVRKLGLGPEIRAYESTIESLRAAHQVVDGTVHSTIVTGWDNTPRSGRRGLVLTGYEQASFERAIQAALELEGGNPRSMLFIKSWNEWAEGNTIEPRFNASWNPGEVLARHLAGWA
jgi:hypothetical protein